MTTASDLASSLQTAATHLKKDARKISNTALNAAHDQVYEPARQAVHRAGEYAHDAFDETRQRVAKHAAHANDLARSQFDRACKWASDHPLAAIGIAVAAGYLIAKSSRIPEER